MALNNAETSAAAFMLMAIAQFAKREIAAFLLNKANEKDLFDLAEYLECAVDTVMSKSVYGDDFEGHLMDSANLFFASSEERHGKVKTHE